MLSKSPDGRSMDWLVWVGLAFGVVLDLVHLLDARNEIFMCHTV